jgi:hypothetical protein
LPNPSKKASAVLGVATAYAKRGDKILASKIAAQIDLTPAEDWHGMKRSERFNYRQPQTWGVYYDAGPGFTLASAIAAGERAAEVAAAAMAFAQAIELQPETSYLDAFKRDAVDVVQALARAHAAYGDVDGALAWVTKLGSDAKLTADYDEVWFDVKRRIHALIGVAQGIVDRTGNKK